MVNAYCDLELLKAEGALGVEGRRYDRRLLGVVEEASRWIDGYCNRRFYVVAERRRFDGCGGRELAVGELVAVTALETRGQPGGRLEVWDGEDYELYPLEARPRRPWGRPYDRVAVSAAAAGRRVFPGGSGTVEIAGRWGFREVVGESGTTIAAGDGMTAEAGELTAAAAGVLAAGQTLLIGEEQLYVTGTDGVTAVVKRGVNGTAAAEHLAEAEIGVYGYPGPVTEACLQLAADWWQRRERLVAAGLTGRGDGPRKSGVWKEVKELLAGYRRLAVG